MRMMNIILSFFILVIFSNVKAASFQDTNSSSPKSIGVISVNMLVVTFSKYNPSYYHCLDDINKALHEQSEAIKYAYEGSNYHWVITDFDISIDNYPRYLNKSISKNRTEALQIGIDYFISYIKANIKHLFSRYMHKYDFKNDYGINLNILAKDLKTLMYDPFDNDFKNNLIRYENEPENKKIRNRAKKTFNALVKNPAMDIKGYFIKMRKDRNYTHLRQNKSLYFTTSISKNDTNSNYDLKSITPNIVESFVKPLRKHNLLSQVC
ncbi:fam-d protein [Plasmodium vinckei]|uniref:Fam-d protein n=1 Tax=Plasmodium vinckei TaxID=5860 RepID=A0A6V7SX94_PLAVN|nr:fam-d protein [Plasmodium vinckei]